MKARRKKQLEKASKGKLSNVSNNELFTELLKRVDEEDRCCLFVGTIKNNKNESDLKIENGVHSWKYQLYNNTTVYAVSDYLEDKRF